MSDLNPYAKHDPHGPAFQLEDGYWWTPLNQFQLRRCPYADQPPFRLQQRWIQNDPPPDKWAPVHRWIDVPVGMRDTLATGVQGHETR